MKINFKKIWKIKKHKKIHKKKNCVVWEDRKKKVIEDWDWKPKRIKMEDEMDSMKKWPCGIQTCLHMVMTIQFLPIFYIAN